jgi:hypothetical protein
MWSDSSRLSLSGPAEEDFSRSLELFARFYGIPINAGCWQPDSMRSIRPDDFAMNDRLGLCRGSWRNSYWYRSIDGRGWVAVIMRFSIS